MQNTKMNLTKPSLVIAKISNNESSQIGSCSS